MGYLGLKLSTSIVALALVVVHLVWLSVKIDTITLGLLVERQV